jgi:predicted kinase
MASVTAMNRTAPMILVAGLPGAGKTTVARRLAEGFSRSVHLEVDGLRKMMVRGHISPADTGGWSEAYAAQFLMESEAACALATCYVGHGVAVVLDDIALPPLLSRSYADVAALHKVLLMPSLDALLARLQRRQDIYDATFSAAAPALHAMLVRARKESWTVFDNSDWDAERTAAEVMASRPDSGRI